MTWELKYLPEAQADLNALDNSIRKPVIKGIKKVQQNPVSKEEGDTAHLSEIKREITLPDFSKSNS